MPYAVPSAKKCINCQQAKGPCTTTVSPMTRVWAGTQPTNVAKHARTAVRKMMISNQIMFQVMFQIMFSHSFHHDSWLFDDWWVVGDGSAAPYKYVYRWHLDLPHSLFKWCFLSASRLSAVSSQSPDQRNQELRGRPAPSPWHFKGALKTFENYT